MGLPKRARTADWKNGVLTLDGEKQYEIPELTMDLTERLAGYTLVGFHVKGYPVTDELLSPFAGHKSMVNFGVEDGTLTDAFIIYPNRKEYIGINAYEWLEDESLYIYLYQKEELEAFTAFFQNEFSTK